MAKTLNKIEDIVAKMMTATGQNKTEIAIDMEITPRHLRRCLESGKIPYKGIINWCLEHNKKLEDYLLKEK